MEYFIVFIFILVMLYFFNTSNQNPKKSYTYTSKNTKPSFEKKSKNQKILEAKNIVSRVKTQQDLDWIENKIYAYDEYEYDYDEEFEILNMVLEYAKEIPYRYFYAYTVNTETPLEELKLVGKLFSSQERSEIIAKNYKLYLVEILLTDENHAKQVKNDVENCLYNKITKNELRELIEFRKIIEADDIDRVLENKFNEIVIKSKYIQKDLGLTIKDDQSLYTLCKQKLTQREKIKQLYPCPSAKNFVYNGYETLDEIFKLSDKDILAIKGIGEKSLEKIRNFQKNRKVKHVPYRPILKR